jgi:hypothetical protein
MVRVELLYYRPGLIVTGADAKKIVKISEVGKQESQDLLLFSLWKIFLSKYEGVYRSGITLRNYLGPFLGSTIKRMYQTYTFGSKKGSHLLKYNTYRYIINNIYILGHYFVKLLEEKGKLATCLTQNVDGLERLAGITVILP